MFLQYSFKEIYFTNKMAFRINFQRPICDDVPSNVDHELNEIQKYEEKLRLKKERLQKLKLQETDKIKNQETMINDKSKNQERMIEKESQILEKQLLTEGILKGERGEKGDKGERGISGYTVSNYLIYRKLEQQKSLVTVLCEDINNLKHIDLVCKGKGDVIFYFPTGHSLTQTIDVQDYTIYKLDLSGMTFPKLQSSQLIHVMCNPSQVSDTEIPTCLEFMMIKVTTHQLEI